MIRLCAEHTRNRLQRLAVSAAHACSKVLFHIALLIDYSTTVMEPCNIPIQQV